MQRAPRVEGLRFHKSFLVALSLEDFTDTFQSLCSVLLIISCPTGHEDLLYFQNRGQTEGVI